MSNFRTPFCGYSVQFSPYEESKLAVATAQYFGVVGNGMLHILVASPRGLQQIYSVETNDGLYDVAWNEGNENQLLAASADGTIKLFDIGYQQPLNVFHEHTGEVFSVNSNYKKHTLFVSSSYDSSIKLWDLTNPASLNTYAEHQGCVYNTSWHPIQ